MAAPPSAMSKDAILSAVKKATRDKRVTITARKAADLTTTLVVEGIVVSNDGDSFRFHPDGVDNAEATALVPDGKADTEYIEIKVKGGETHHDVDLFSLRKTVVKSNLLGIVEYEPKSWVKAITNADEAQHTMLLTMIMQTLDGFYNMSPRPPGSYGTLSPADEEKHTHREVIQAFLTLACRVEINTGVYELVMQPVVRLCALRRAQTSEGDKRKRILAKAHQILLLPDLKKREEEWIKYNNQAAGSEPLN